ncbi:MAG: hypothetical protein SangKO_098280 [Sandaracinaceae bacterium]
MCPELDLVGIGEAAQEPAADGAGVADLHEDVVLPTVAAPTDRAKVRDHPRSERGQLRLRVHGHRARAGRGGCLRGSSGRAPVRGGALLGLRGAAAAEEADDEGGRDENGGVRASGPHDRMA